MSLKPDSYRSGPDKSGHFGHFGGRYIAETLMPPVMDLEKAWRAAQKDRAFRDTLNHYLRDYVGRPSPLFHARRLATAIGTSARIYLKREDLNHTGAHKINNCLGQVMLARRMGKTRIIAETGAGQHGVATATVAALFGLPCTIYMGKVDMERQTPNVFRMRLLGAKVVAVESGSATLKDALNEALRDWVANVDDTFYIIGSVAGPHPYPEIVRSLQSVIGKETRKQCLKAEGKLPDLLLACVGGGSNAIGLFHPFLDDASVAMVGVEAAGEGLKSKRHAAAICGGSPGVLHGNRTYLIQDEDGQIAPVHSISAGLDYPGIGPEHAWLADIGRVRYAAIDDRAALDAFSTLSRVEGIIPALESAHALAYLAKIGKTLKKDSIVVVNLSGRGDKDLSTIVSMEKSVAQDGTSGHE